MSKRVVIIGGGVIGLSAAAECARRGHQVTVIEPSPATRGSSLGNAGMVVPSHFVPLAAPGMVALGLKWMWNPESPFYIQPRLDLSLISWAWRFWQASTTAHVRRCAPLLRDLHTASREAYAKLAATEDFGLVTKGLLMLCKSQHTLDEEADVAARAGDLGIAARVLSAAQVAALDPGITMDVTGGVHYPHDCHLQPERYVGMLEQQIRVASGELLYDTQVTGFQKRTSHLNAAITTKGEIEADQFVLSSGAWSAAMAQQLGLRLPMQAGRGYSVTLSDPVQIPQLCSILTEARVAVTPMGKTLRFGGTMEITRMNVPPQPRRVKGILKAAQDYFPQFERRHFDGIEPWHGLRPCSPDGMPYLGRTQAYDNLVIATGHAMMGLSLAPVTGQIVGQFIDDETPTFDLSLLSPNRYA
jgi:D-amino-acid dehydrogenase